MNKEDIWEQILLELVSFTLFALVVLLLTFALCTLCDSVSAIDVDVPVEARMQASTPYPKDIVLEPVVLRATAVIIKKSTSPKPVITTARQSRGLVEDSSRATMHGFQVTWYNNYYDGTDKTASCTTTTAGRTMAVDPRVIPIGTWVEMTFPNGDVYIRKAEDTGSKVKGKIIDIYSDASNSAIMQRGRTHNVTVKILVKE